MIYIYTYLESLLLSLGLGLLLVQTDHCDLRMRETCGRDVIVVHYMWVAQDVLYCRDALIIRKRDNKI